MTYTESVRGLSINDKCAQCGTIVLPITSYCVYMYVCSIFFPWQDLNYFNKFLNFLFLTGFTYILILLRDVGFTNSAKKLSGAAMISFHLLKIFFWPRTFKFWEQEQVWWSQKDMGQQFELKYTEQHNKKSRERHEKHKQNS